MQSLLLEGSMDFEPAYTLEQESFRAELRSWLEQHVPTIDGNPKSDENYAKYRELGREMGQRGWLGPTAPVEYGGGGLTAEHAIVLAEEIDRYDLSIPPYYDQGSFPVACTLVWGTEEQKRRLVTPILRGDGVTWMLLTGPEAGSDLAGTVTDAKRDGDEYVLNGEKIFIGADRDPDYLWTIARTNPDGERHQNLSWFVIPRGLPGITINRMQLLGDSEQMKNTVYFDNVRVSAENLIGGENNGWQVASTHLELEHGGGGRIGQNRWFRRAHDVLTELKRDGRPLIEYEDVQERLVDLFLTTEVSRLFDLRNFWMNTTHQAMTYEGSQSSYYRKVGGLEMARALMDMAGPYALTDDDDWDSSDGQLEAFMRQSIIALHPGGTADIQKVIMARRMGVGRQVAEQAGRTS
jgi:alkylation response protein AidB-like acyl-CoA dehydrogenase